MYVRTRRSGVRDLTSLLVVGTSLPINFIFIHVLLKNELKAAVPLATIEVGIRTWAIDIHIHITIRLKSTCMT